jgi:hypothetical protein
MSAVKAKAEPARTPAKQSEPVDARPPRPVQGSVDYDALITKAMKKFPKTRARLAE